MTYEQFMKHHTSKPGEAYTHTRIGDKALNVHGGVYTIPPAILPVFCGISGSIRTMCSISAGKISVEID
jgi:hypothetical protein